MATQQILLYAAIALMVLVYVRRFLLLRGVKQYSPFEVAERIGRSPAVVVLDVRTKGERQRSNIKGSLHIPLHELGRRIEELSVHKAREIICYCQSGNRSLSAAARLRKSGFNAANMKGGIVEWNSRSFS
jgi:rhodanese-related sulfurtransferase